MEKIIEDMVGHREEVEGVEDMTRLRGPMTRSIGGDCGGFKKFGGQDYKPRPDITTQFLCKDLGRVCRSSWGVP